MDFLNNIVGQLGGADTDNPVPQLIKLAPGTPLPSVRLTQSLAQASQP